MTVELTMRYENHTTTALELVRGDIRDAPASFVLIGRDPDLKSHFERQTGNSFNQLSSWLQDFPVQVSRAKDRSLSVLRTTIRPTESSRHRQQQMTRLQDAVEMPLTHTFCDASEIAMTPISWRAPDVVATAMVRMIWDISVAAFLNAQSIFPTAKPVLFTIYCNKDLQPFIDVLDSGHYASLRHARLFSTEVQCNRAKRARYLHRQKFKFHRT